MESKALSSSQQSVEEGNQRGRGRGKERGRGRGSDSGRGRSIRGNIGAASSSSWADYPSQEVMIEKPIYNCKANDLLPGTMGHTLTIKVLSSTPISTATQLPLAECLVGDDSAVILFTARGISQVHLMTPGKTVVLRNARITLCRGSMRLCVDRLHHGTEYGEFNNTNPKQVQLVKLPREHDFDVKTDNNLSLIQFEFITLESIANTVWHHHFGLFNRSPNYNLKDHQFYFINPTKIPTQRYR